MPAIAVVLEGNCRSRLRAQASLRYQRTRPFDVIPAGMTKVWLRFTGPPPTSRALVQRLRTKWGPRQPIGKLPTRGVAPIQLGQHSTANPHRIARDRLILHEGGGMAAAGAYFGGVSGDRGGDNPRHRPPPTRQVHTGKKLFDCQKERIRRQKDPNFGSFWRLLCRSPCRHGSCFQNSAVAAPTSQGRKEENRQYDHHTNHGSEKRGQP